MKYDIKITSGGEGNGRILCFMLVFQLSLSLSAIIISFKLIFLQSIWIRTGFSNYNKKWSSNLLFFLFFLSLTLASPSSTSSSTSTFSSSISSPVVARREIEQWSRAALLSRPIKSYFKNFTIIITSSGCSAIYFDALMHRYIFKDISSFNPSLKSFQSR